MRDRLSTRSLIHVQEQYPHRRLSFSLSIIIIISLRRNTARARVLSLFFFVSLAREGEENTRKIDVVLLTAVQSMRRNDSGYKGEKK